MPVHVGEETPRRPPRGCLNRRKLILIAVEKLPDAEILDLLAAIEKEAQKRNLR
jgi:hypothetical protein